MYFAMEAPTPVSSLLHAATQNFKTNTYSLGRQHLLHYIITNHIFYLNSFFFSFLILGWAIIATRLITLNLIVFLKFIFSPFIPGLPLCDNIAEPCRNKEVDGNTKVGGKAITTLTKVLPAFIAKQRGNFPRHSMKVQNRIITRSLSSLCKRRYLSQHSRKIEEFIPWKLTSAGINALTSINKIYIWIPKENPIKSFIDTYCLDLLKSKPFLGKKDTGILTSFYSVESMLSNSTLLDCEYLRSPEKAFDDISSSYIYSRLWRLSIKKTKGFILVLLLTLQVDFTIIFILELQLDKVYCKKPEERTSLLRRGWF